MNLEIIRQLLDLVREHDLAEFELDHDGLRLRVRKDGVGAPIQSAVGAAPAGAPHSAAPAPPAAPLVAPPVEVTSPAASQEDMELAVVSSPIVGTFFRAPDPTAPPFAEVGQSVARGQVLCIIEAMKLMNEIESEYDGEIVRVFVENGQPVQYGERLFAIRVR